MTGGEQRLVPWAPGPLIDPRAAGNRDELDELVDDLFPDVEGGPGVFDAALVASGVGLLGWALATGQGRGWIVAAAVLLTLGLVLPARSVLRRVGARRSGWTEYLPLDAGDASGETAASCAHIGQSVGDRPAGGGRLHRVRQSDREGRPTRLP